ncbi:hypothetical protein Plhal304r1_c020g0070821 [Plasmopara halstedii]
MRTFKGTVRALIDLKRTPQLQINALMVSRRSDGKRSAVVEVPRISATAASSVQSQVQKLVADGHVVAERDSTSGTEVTYRYQGNLDHYTEDNLAKRLSLQQHPHMIALTQRLWSCALRNGETRLTFADYETYMLCLHRLVLPDFDIEASKDLILDDWKRDCGEQDYLDYSYFHLSMFELVDLWTDTVDPEDYISLLYCITHCLTYLLNERHFLKALRDVSTVDVLEESKGVRMETIEQDLQRELDSDAFAYHQDQIKLATEANQNAERESRELNGPQKTSQGSIESISRPRSFGSHESGSPRRQSQSLLDGSGDSSRSKVQERRRSSRLGVQERRRSSLLTDQKDGIDMRNTELMNQRRKSRSSSIDHDQNFSKRKVSLQTSTLETNSISDTSASKFPAGLNTSTGVAAQLTLNSQSASEQPGSLTAYSHGNAVPSAEKSDEMMISQSIVDSKSSFPVPSEPALAPRRDSQGALSSRPHRQYEAAREISVKQHGFWQASEQHAIQINGLETSHRPVTQDPNAPGYRLIPDADISQKSYAVRTAALANAAARLPKSGSSIISRRSFSAAQRTLHKWQQRTPRFVPNEATKDTLPNVYVENGSLTVPLMTISSSKVPTLAPSINAQQPKLQEMHGTRLQTPFESRFGVSNPSPRASIAMTAQPVGLFLSSQHRPVKPLISPRSSSTIGNMNSNYRPSRLHVYQQPTSMSATVPLAINGRIASNIKFDHSVEANMPLSAGLSGGRIDASHELRASLSSRYAVTEQVASHNLISKSNVKQFSPRPRGGYVRMNESFSKRHRYSILRYNTRVSHPSQQRQQWRPSEHTIVPKLE